METEQTKDAALFESRSDLYLELGRQLFKSGATSQRVVDSISRAASIIGDAHPPLVLVEYDAIILETGSGSSARIRMNQAKGFSGVDVSILTSISRILRSNGPSSMSLDSFKNALSEAAHGELHYSRPLLVLAAVLSGIGFDLLNGADMLSLGSLIPAAIAVYLIRTTLIRNSFNLYAATLIAVAAGGVLAAFCARLTGTGTPQIAFIAPMLFLVPGPAMINGGVDILRNHNNMGLARVTFTFVMVSMITLGLALALAILPPPPTPASWHPPAELALHLKLLYDGLLGAFAACGLAMINNAHRKTLIAFIVCGALARALRALSMHYGIDIVTSTLIATAISTIISTRIARAYFAPAYVMSVVAVLSMVPGLFAIEGLNGLFAIASGPASPELLASTAQSLLKAIFISASLTAGVIVPMLILDRNSPRI